MSLVKKAAAALWRSRGKGLLAYGLALTMLAPAQVTDTLRLEVLEGDGIFNDVKKSVSGGSVVVLVKDRSDRIVPGAKVTFSMPFSGPGMTFANGAREQAVTADDTGKAVMPPAKPNKEEGRFNIKVTATNSAGQTGSVVVGQSNTIAIASGKKGPSRAYAIMSLVGGGATTGLLLWSRRGGGSSGGTTPAGPTSTSLSAGVLTVGAPR